MHLFNKAVIVLISAFLLQTGCGYADTIFLRNGDILSGDIQTDFFALEGPAGQIIVRRDFVKKLSLTDGSTGKLSIETINNDVLSGIALNQVIRLRLDSAINETIKIEDIEQILPDTSGPSYPISTAIFTVKNSDRFSGKLLEPQIKIQSNYLTKSYSLAEINRIEFTKDQENSAKILLNNGDVIQGELVGAKMTIAPDSMGWLTVDKSILDSVQLNARKLILKEYGALPPSEKDGDGDGVSDPADNCPNTPWGEPVDKHGCSKDSGNKELIAKRTQARQDIGLDTDQDGIPDNLDQCPGTPAGTRVNDRGCWEIKGILFEFDRYEIRPQYHAAVDEVIEVLKQNPSLAIEIQGHTDNLGAPAYNQALSEKRARAVKVYMQTKGIEPARLRAVGYGSAGSIASNDTAAGRALNRRIEIVVIN